MMQGGSQMAGLNMQQAQGWGQFGSGMMQVAGYAMGGGFGNNAFGGQKTLPSLGISNGPMSPWS
jgi:hypothetical protein